MDDQIRPVPPLAPRPADRQRDQRQRRQDGEREAGTAASTVEPAPAITGDAPAVAEPSPLIAALDRLRATEAPRPADLTMIRLWRALRAYQEPVPAAGDEPAAGVDAAGPGPG